ncbi:MAG: sulfatase-like hydrolase/transferase [Gammaproteobacteria bacterium]|nr:sulfatase-like hydrolase/transferase [Gammaproteobacteria bacterium]
MSVSLPSFSAAKSTPNILPNMLIVVADDMGWSDPGFMGGEISTPTLDDLAHHGMVFNRFYVAPTCSPTRSMLMTGVDHHRAGLGTMVELLRDNQRGKPGYEGYLNTRFPTLAERFQVAGYNTYFSGKWHLGKESAQLPSGRGFSRSFALMQGGASHFGDMAPLFQDYAPSYYRDGKPVVLPEKFYSSVAYTDELISYIRETPESEPFLAVLAFTAPHDPLQVPDSWLDHYRGKYDQGPGVISAARVRRQQTMGLVPIDVAYQTMMPVESKPSIYATERSRSTRSMEIYAAMLTLMDQQLARLIAYLRQQGRLDNTVIAFFSDNGASGLDISDYPHTDHNWITANSNNSFDNIGCKGSRISLGPLWGAVANTPLRLYKGSVAEGGIRSHLILTGPGIVPRQTSSTPIHITDLVPTLMTLAGLVHNYSDDSFDGVSLTPLLRGDAVTDQLTNRDMGFELFGDKALIRGHWKISQLRSSGIASVGVIQPCC